MRLKPYKLLFLFLPFCCVACWSNYQIVKSNRTEYNISDELVVDSGIMKTYLPYKQKMDAQMSQVIGRSAIQLTKSDAPETLLGDFFSDAAINQAKKLEPNIDFAVPTTKGGLRNDVPKGDLTLSAMFEMMPFENELVLLKLKGTDVEALLNFIAATGGQPVSDLRLKIKDKQPYDVLIKDQPFDRNKTYTVLTSDYLANGGDNIKGLAAPLERKVIGLRVRDALINYVKLQTADGKLIDAQLDGRITKL